MGVAVDATAAKIASCSLRAPVVSGGLAHLAEKLLRSRLGRALE